MITVWIALAGGAGAGVRYVIDSLVTARWRHDFPLGTLLINVSGSLLLGVLTGLVIAHDASSSWTKVAGTGFCGGYTTFSAATVESIALAYRGRLLASYLNTVGSVGLTIFAAAVGLWLTGA
ncbi:MAG: fluoride efflux transporter CrcB [Frankiaceae bacterium]|nr:fluoride efflux transporter CrcB [Frankiaceae bacterium]MBV9872453.1 fluoride efflux transporter CrcB [Frankiaceae bacterium]